jgi:hypothetical protein
MRKGKKQRNTATIEGKRRGGRNRQFFTGLGVTKSIIEAGIANIPKVSGRDTSAGAEKARMLDKLAAKDAKLARRAAKHRARTQGEPS